MADAPPREQPSAAELAAAELAAAEEAKRVDQAHRVGVEKLCPPPEFFRVVKRVRETKTGIENKMGIEMKTGIENKTATATAKGKTKAKEAQAKEKETWCVEWLCLPHQLRPVLAAEEDDTSDVQDDSTAGPVASPPTADRPEGSTGIAGVKRDFDTAFPTEQASRDLLRQLVVVKMHTTHAALRNEADTLETLRNAPGNDAFIAACALHVRLTTVPKTSFLELRPVFNKTLTSFGEACLTSDRRVPTYFVWHTFLSLVSALEFVHGATGAHGDLSADNVVVRWKGPVSGQQYRDWPDVLLTGFGAAHQGYELYKRNDVTSMAYLVNSVIEKWSDVGALVKFMDAATQQRDPLIRFATSLQAIIATASRNAASKEAREEIPTLKGVKAGWEEVADAERAKGPEICPEWLGRLARDDLVTDGELAKAMRPPLVLKLNKESGKYKQWLRWQRSPVALRKGPGDEAPNLLVFKFKFASSREALAKLGMPASASA